MTAKQGETFDTMLMSLEVDTCKSGTFTLQLVEKMTTSTSRNSMVAPWMAWERTTTFFESAVKWNNDHTANYKNALVGVRILIINKETNIDDFI